MIRLVKVPLLAFFVLLISIDVSAAGQFCFHPPGKLDPRDSATGNTDRTVLLPDIAFPLRVGSASGLEAHLNSQIFGYGGMDGPGGSLSDSRNFQGCWEDTYCEGKRGWQMPLCPSRIGHQGDDIRANGPDENKYDAVAVMDGYVRLVTKNTTVVLAGDDGTECRYLHMDPQSIPGNIVGKRVQKGQSVLGRVSNWMNGQHHGTSTHLHFDCSQTVQLQDGSQRDVHIPIYTSLILAYARQWGIGGVSIQGGELSASPPFEIP